AKSKGTVYINPIKENYDEIDEELNCNTDESQFLSQEAERFCKDISNDNSSIHSYSLIALDEV
ncbi:hypothetical protein, partial [Spirosoma migulaei]